MRRLLAPSAPLAVLLAAAAVSAAPPARNYSYTEKTFADSTAGDFTAGEDALVRRVAVEALGRFNGSVVVLEADTGRALTIVNQKLALSDGYIPCSTIKLVTALAALSEGLVEPETRIWFDGEWFMTMGEALAISNNVYFDFLGEQLGFERVRRYALLFGFGEKAGWRIPGEQLGAFPERQPKWRVGRMTSFGDGIAVTPIQLAAFTAALANGGSLYYVQHPASPELAARLRPKIKRRLPIARWLPAIEEAMAASVGRGTSKKARVAGQRIRGKTGTCSFYQRRSRTRLGWFASYNRAGNGRSLVVVVMLRGGSMVYGPRAAEIAGAIYRGLAERRYFSSSSAPIAAASPAACCAE